MSTPRLAPPTSTARDSPTVGLSPSYRLGTSQSPTWSSTPATALKSLAPRSRPFSTATDLACCDRSTHGRSEQRWRLGRQERLHLRDRRPDGERPADGGHYLLVGQRELARFEAGADGLDDLLVGQIGRASCRERV